jgi:hypothetical protein
VIFNKQRFCVNSRYSGKDGLILQKFCLKVVFISQKLCAGSRKYFVSRHYGSNKHSVLFPESLNKVFFNKQRFCVNSRYSGKRDLILQKFCLMVQKFWTKCFHLTEIVCRFKEILCISSLWIKQALKLISRESKHGIFQHPAFLCKFQIFWKPRSHPTEILFDGPEILDQVFSSHRNCVHVQETLYLVIMDQTSIRTYFQRVNTVFSRLTAFLCEFQIFWKTRSYHTEILCEGPEILDHVFSSHRNCVHVQ